MIDTPTTPASVASRLTDDEILRRAHVEERYLDHKTAAVLRDYVRLRKLANAVAETVKYKDDVDEKIKDGFIITAVGAVEQIKRLLVEAEKGDAK